MKDGEAKVVAVDGPSGAGKSSASRRVGEALGFLHVDSGALYRILTWRCLARRVDVSDPAAVAELAHRAGLDLKTACLRLGYLGEAELRELLDPEKMV